MFKELGANAEFYVDWEEKEEAWCVFDTEQGKRWGRFLDEEHAEEKAEDMNRLYQAWLLNNQD